MSEEGKAFSSYAEDPILRVLCDAAGLTREEFAANRTKLEVLETFNQSIPTMVSVSWFPRLTRLMFNNQSIKDISGLNDLTGLECLWLNENNISKISGLEGCVNLRELYLSSNNLTRIEGIGHLSKLEVFWAVDNKITSVEGFERNSKLRVLWLGRNLIDTYARKLDGLQALEEINLAGNKLWHLREIPSLDRLPCLKVLYLSDPTLGDNPVCHICNYQTFTLFHLKKLKILDYVTISDEQRQLAEATFFKKKIYYNMRIKTIQRNSWSLIRKAEHFKTSKLAMINGSIATLQRSSRELERDLHDGIELSTQSEVQIESKMKEIAAVVRYKQKNVDIVEQYLENMKKGIQMCTQDQISRLLLELHTGGNVRLEDGQAKDVWCQSCVELVRSRFIPADFEPYGIKDIRVTRVVRVHNRLLRSRFDERLAQLVDVSENSYKKAVEYLFYAAPNADPFRIMEEGVTDISDSGAEVVVPLTNSVFLADQARLMKEKGGLAQSTELIPGRLVVCKVFLGKTAPERTAAVPNDPTVPVVLAEPKIKRKDYAATTQTVFRHRSQDAKQRIWYSFEPCIVIPEYIVEYVYCNSQTLPMATLPEPHEKETSRANQELRDVLDKLFPSRSDYDNADMKAVAHHFLMFVHSCNTLIPAQEAPLEVLAQGPLPKPHAKSNALDLSMLCGIRNPSTITYLNSAALTVRRIEPNAFSAFSSLKVLILAFNELTRIENLSGLYTLETLDLSHNVIRRVENLGGLPSLRSVDLSHNVLDGVDVVWGLQSMLPELAELTLRGNAFRDYRKLQDMLIKGLPKLMLLDGATIPHTTRVEAETSVCTAMTPRTIVQDVHGAKELCTSQEEVGVLMRLPEIRLCGKHISHVQNLDVARCVQTLNLSENMISRMGGISALPSNNKLEELYLSGNYIPRIEGLEEEAHFLRLRRLDLSRNRLLSLTGLEGCPNLTFLSVEDNEISSLSGVHVLVNLMEMYASNNAIESVKEVNALRDMHKLIVMDLAHNPLCLDPEYRVYTVFTLKKLKVLDGIPIDTTEANNARETLSGKMTLELLLERANKQSTDQVRDLNLSSCSLKEIAQLHAFPNLQHLKIDHNLLTDISGLVCSNLVSLNLAFNRITGVGIGKQLELLNKIESISLESNLITNLAMMQLNLPSLKFLNLKNNEIVKVEGLELLPSLRELILDKNRIRSFEPNSFSQNVYLKELRCEDNMLKSLDGLRHLQCLTKVVLCNNRVADVSELEKVEGLEKLSEINMQGNSVVRKALYRSMLIYRLPRLALIDGKEVTTEERERTHQYYAQDYVGSQVPPNVYLDNRTITVGAVQIAVSLASNMVVPNSNPGSKGPPNVPQSSPPAVVVGSATGPSMQQVPFANHVMTLQRGRQQIIAGGPPVPTPSSQPSGQGVTSTTVTTGARNTRTSSAEGGGGAVGGGRIEHANSAIGMRGPRPKPSQPTRRTSVPR